MATESMPKKEFASPPPDYGGSLFEMQQQNARKASAESEATEHSDAASTEPYGSAMPQHGERREPVSASASAPREATSYHEAHEALRPPNGILSKISAEDILLFGAALFLLFSKESDNIIIPALLVLVIML